MFNREGITTGMVVRSYDGDKLGKIVGIEGDSLLIEKGIFFPKDYRCSFDQVDDIYEGDIYLKWGTDLVETNYDSYYGAGSYAKDTSDESLWTDYSRRDKSYSGESREHMSIPLREEELAVERRGMKERGRVRIVKTVHTEDKTFTVPVRREEVRVERVSGSELGSTGNLSSEKFEDKTVTIPIMEEEVEISKRTVAKEAVKVTTESQTYEKPVHGEVRKEDVRIERDDADLKKKKAI